MVHHQEALWYGPSHGEFSLCMSGALVSHTIIDLYRYCEKTWYCNVVYLSSRPLISEQLRLSSLPDPGTCEIHVTAWKCACINLLFIQYVALTPIIRVVLLYVLSYNHCEVPMPTLVRKWYCPGMHIAPPPYYPHAYVQAGLCTLT